MAKKQDTIENVVLCQGAVLGKDFFEVKENRLLTLLLKGFIVYLLSMGSIGFYLSSFHIAYNALLCHMVILGMSMFCAMLYYRLLVENLGYLLLLVLFATLVMGFRDYINSGFYAIVNITVDSASSYFDVDIQRMYNEKIGNRYLTVTFVALFIGIVLDILLNVYVSRRMQYATAIFIIMSLNLIPLYLVQEPDMLYVVMMLAGISMAVVFKAGKHYSPQVAVKRNNRVFKIQSKKKKRELSYVYDVKAMLQAGVWAVTVAMVTVVAVSTIRPKDSFNVGYKMNKYKDLSMAAASTLLVDGWTGFYRTHSDVAGVDSGKLGNVSSIRVDNQTDLIVQMTPYNGERVYLRNFVGVRYNPYENTWTNMYHMSGYPQDGRMTEADALKDAYEENYQGSAEGVMKIRNVGLPQDSIFQPYYTGDVRKEKGTYYMTYYPRLEANSYKVTRDYYEGEPYTDADLFVPMENREAIQDFVENLGYLGTQDEMIEAVQNYFQENIPYTIRPGKTPRRRDFINYFLEENQKGYCVHFASAAVLAYRYMGIPARYVEGYAIDFEEMLDGEMVEGSVYADYYKGYNEFGETGLVEIEVPDADAHAWVEVYDSKRGWHPVEVTPASFEDEEEVVDFWEEFADFMSDGNEDAGEITDGENNFVVSDTLVRNVIIAILGLVCVFVIVLLGREIQHLFLFSIRFKKANINDKLILKYSRFVKKKSKNKEFARLYNYRDQMDYVITEHENKNNPEIAFLKQEKEKMLLLLERAGFSNHMISEEEYNMALDYLKKCQ